MLRVAEATNLYLTPELTQRAERAGVMALDMNPEAFSGVCAIVNQAESTVTKNHFTVDDVAVVMRWAGMMGLSRDIRYGSANMEQPYLGTEHYGVQSEEDRSTTKGALEIGARAILEMDIYSWKGMEYGSALARSLLDYGNYPQHLLGALWHGYEIQQDPAKFTRHDIRERAQRLHPSPIGVL
ncbi:MAG TPA: hypothetical protein VLH38_02815 [Patescibacteria group bacterium]|nr:hypothetical protein [Patescibacteria group bacterium]